MLVGAINYKLLVFVELHLCQAVSDSKKGKRTPSELNSESPRA